MNTTFSTHVRILLCTHCGAPLEAPPAGGQIHCRYCRAINQLMMRDERPVFTPVQQAPLQEQERIHRLRAQDGRPLLPPPSLLPLVQNGQIAPWKVQEALSIWQATRQELRASPSNYEAAERLLFLTMLLSNHFSEQSDPLRQRAMLESALDAVTLPRHRQILRGYLSRHACREGDLTSAEQWIAPCDPRSDDLETDSAYRFSRALIDTARGDYNAVLRTLGARAEDVPLQDAMDMACAALRANAWERLGNVAAAMELLQKALEQGGPQGRQALAKFVALNPRFGLCAQSLPLAQAQHGSIAGKQAAQAASGGIHKVFIPIGVLSLIGALVCVVVFVLGLLLDWEGAPLGAGITLLTLGPLGLVFGGIGFAMRKAALKAERLRVHGIEGTGRIVSMSPTGMSINDVPQMEFRLQIQLPGRAPYEASTKMLLHPTALATAMPGATVAVRVDPQDPSSMMIETG